MLGENIFKDIFKRSLILLTIAIILIVALTKEPKSYIYGYVFGMIINILNFRLMSLSIRRSVTLTPKGAQRHAVTGYMTRYLTYGMVFYIAAVADHINIYTVALGFLTVKIIIISDTFYDIIKGNKK